MQPSPTHTILIPCVVLCAEYIGREHTLRWHVCITTCRAAWQRSGDVHVYVLWYIPSKCCGGSVWIYLRHPPEPGSPAKKTQLQITRVTRERTICLGRLPPIQYPGPSATNPIPMAARDESETTDPPQQTKYQGALTRCSIQDHLQQISYPRPSAINSILRVTHNKANITRPYI